MENFGHSDFSFVKYTFEHGSVWTSFWRWISKEGGKEKKETEAATSLKASWRENEQPRESSSSLDRLRGNKESGKTTIALVSLSPLFFSHFPDTFQASLAFSKAFQVFILPLPSSLSSFLPFSFIPLPSPPTTFSPSRYDDAKIALRLWIAENAIRDWREGRRRRREGWNLKFKEIGNRRLLK